MLPVQDVIPQTDLLSISGVQIVQVAIVDYQKVVHSETMEEALVFAFVFAICGLSMSSTSMDSLRSCMIVYSKACKISSSFLICFMDFLKKF